MNSIIVGADKEGDYIALVSNKSEVEALQERIKNKELEGMFRETYPIKNVVGIGNPKDTTDDEIRRFIRFRTREGDKLYACHCPVDHYLVNHYNAYSSWDCALQAMKYPSHVILILAPRVIDSTQAEKAVSKEASKVS